MICATNESSWSCEKKNCKTIVIAIALNLMNITMFRAYRNIIESHGSKHFGVVTEMFTTFLGSPNLI